MSDLTQTIQRVLDLDREATGGPWRVGHPPPNGQQTIGSGGLMLAITTTYDQRDKSNAALIAECRTAAPELARALLESQAALAAAEEGRVAALDIAKGAYEARDALRSELQAANARAKELDDEATMLATEDIATTEQVLRAVRVERDALRADAEAMKRQRDNAIVEKALAVQKIDVERDALRAQVEELRGVLREAMKPTWACAACGAHGDGFTDVHYPAGDADVQCNACGSKDTAEIDRVLYQVNEDRHAAREEAETLRRERDLAYEEKALADREFVASQKSVRELVDGLRDAKADIERVYDHYSPAEQARSNPMSQLGLWCSGMRKIDALLAKHAAPAPTPDKDEEAAFLDTIQVVTSGLCVLWTPDDSESDENMHGGESEAIAAANAHNAARLAKKGGES